MTSNITIGNLTDVKAAKVSWKTDVNSFTDTCTIELPRITYLITTKPQTEDIQNQNDKKTEYAFKEGDKVDVLLGYNGNNTRRFKGFIKRVNMALPVKVECEGYSYLLYDVMFSKTYANVTVVQLLKDLFGSSDIILSKEIPNIPLKNVRFKNATGIQVLEWLQKECKLAVYFNFNEIYVGTIFGKVQETIELQLGWNTVKEDDFKKRWVDKNVRIVIHEKNDKGEVYKAKADVHKYSDEKAIKIKAGIPKDLMQQIVNRLQTKSNYNGYEGSIVAFLEPTANKGMVAHITDKQYTDRTGRYFIESVSGEFGTSGGRQTIQLGFLMSAP